MIFQDPLSAMHPFYTVGHQIVEAYRVHNDVSTSAATKHAVEMLDRVGIPQPASRVDDYPHQFSGGMRQRAMIAMALSCDPDLLIADEPTTALDVTVQAQILDLIRDLQKEFDSAVIIITHDLGVVAELVRRHPGHVRRPRRGVRRADESSSDPEHPYTWGLLSSMPRLDRVRTERLRPDHRRAAEPHQRAVWLPVPPALRLRRPHRRPVADRAPSVQQKAPRSLRRVPPPAEDRDSIWATTSGRRCDDATTTPGSTRTTSVPTATTSPDAGAATASRRDRCCGSPT